MYMMLVDEKKYTTKVECWLKVHNSTPNKKYIRELTRKTIVPCLNNSFG